MRIAIALALSLPGIAMAGPVLGPCGTPEAETPGAALAAPAATAPSSELAIASLPLPGDKAPNFELQAVVGKNDVQTIKLSDYDGKWRVICFYPADFTFV